MKQERLNSTPLLVLVVLIVLLVPAGVAVLAVDSGANFSDSEQFVGNRLGAGSVDIAVNEVVDATQAASRRRPDAADPAVFTATNMAPGDVVSGRLAINNTGTLPIRYWITAKATTSSSALGDWLLFDGWAADDCTTGPDVAEQTFTTNVVLDADHVGLIGTSTGSTDRLVLEPGAAAVMCVGAHLPLSAPNEVQAATVEVELIVYAEHAPEESE